MVGVLRAMEDIAERRCAPEVATSKSDWSNFGSERKRPSDASTAASTSEPPHSKRFSRCGKNLFRQGRIVDRTGKGQRADEPGERRDRAFAPARCGAIFGQAGVAVQLRAHICRQCVTDALVPARNVGAQRRDGAAIRSIGAVPLRQVVGHRIVKICEAASFSMPRCNARITSAARSSFDPK